VGRTLALGRLASVGETRHGRSHKKGVIHLLERSVKESSKRKKTEAYGTPPNKQNREGGQITFDCILFKKEGRDERGCSQEKVPQDLQLHLKE